MSTASSRSPESFGQTHLLSAADVSDMLNINQGTLHGHLGPHLHRLALPSLSRTSYRYSADYLAGLVGAKTEAAPAAPLATFTREFSVGSKALELITNTEEAFESALETQLQQASESRRVITRAGIVSLLGVVQPTVVQWAKTGLLVQQTLSGEPYNRSRHEPAYFSEAGFREVIEWQRPLALALGDIPSSVTP